MKKKERIELSVILPCRNEELSIKDSILTIKEVFSTYHINGEIIVSDSSCDNSPQIAQRLCTTVIKHDEKGYGRACIYGIQHATGKYIFIADPDSSYDFREIPRFLKFLRRNYDLVIGNRLIGNIDKGAMPWTHRFIGNPFFSLCSKFLFNLEVGDIHCGMRGIKKEAFMKLGIKSNGWEFAQDMIIQAKIHKQHVKELPINYYKRKGKSKMNSFPDGFKQVFIMFHRAFFYRFRF